ncbi:MAG: DUF3793 family protein [bacterium]|nr:DUF3793 family protein [bacterium]
MSQEVFEIVQGMNLKDIRIQMALQCAPLITGIKISNLLIVQNNNVDQVKKILKDSNISYYVLLIREKKTTLLLYKSSQLLKYLSDRRVKGLLMRLGYQDMEITQMFELFKTRYAAYMDGSKSFPHEMGLFLGYPVEDVEGFIENEGRNYLYTGYWKVYENLSKKVKLFKQFEIAKETLIQMVAYGLSIEDVIDIYSDNEQLEAAV